MNDSLLQDFSDLIVDEKLGRQAVGLMSDLELLWPDLETELYDAEDPILVAAYSNGRLPASSLRAIPGGYLSHAAASRWLAMRDHIGRRHGVWIRPLGANSSYRRFAAQQYFWNLYRSGRGNPAAVPGTSNHGWGNAVDVATPVMASLIRRYCHLFGWSHAEGARIGEWWHFTYIGGGRTQVATVDLIQKYCEPEEKVWIRELREARATMNRQRPSGAGPKFYAALEKARKYKAKLELRRTRLDWLLKNESRAKARKYHRGTRRKIISQVITGNKVKL